VSLTHLHIVTHDVPYPASIGGLIDIYYKIIWLHKKGIKIHLHCFAKDITPIKELEQHCENVQYYKRKKIYFPNLSLPYIVGTRTDEKLLQNLLADNHPILFEGVHSTYFISQNKFTNRKTYVRLFNTEHIYYKQLQLHEQNILKKLYFGLEAILLKKYEKSIANKTHFIALSHSDVEHYKNLYNANTINFIPVFLPYDFVKAKNGNGSYCLYHGNLSVSENEYAATWLIENVFSKTSHPLIIAGKKPSSTLKKIASKYKNISIVDSPTETNMQLLIENAHINILPSFNATGVKLKLLNALYNGRYCLVNDAGVAGSGLEDLCMVQNNADAFVQSINTTMQKTFTEKEMQHRSAALKNLYSNNTNAERFIKLLQ
jgi:glycosyltransferase involved in cell wall biosynthesis